MWILILKMQTQSTRHLRYKAFLLNPLSCWNQKKKWFFHLGYRPQIYSPFRSSYRSKVLEPTPLFQTQLKNHHLRSQKPVDTHHSKQPNAHSLLCKILDWHIWSHLPPVRNWTHLFQHYFDIISTQKYKTGSHIDRWLCKSSASFLCHHLKSFKF